MAMESRGPKSVRTTCRNMSLVRLRLSADICMSSTKKIMFRPWTVEAADGAVVVVPGAPVSVLTDHGIPDELVEKLMAAGVGTVEMLGGMTPEQLEEIPGIGDEMVEKIQEAVVSYYGQFESSPEAEAASAETVAAVDSAPTEDAQEQSVTIEIAESPAGAEALDKEQGLI